MSKIDVISAVRFYIDKIVSDPTIGGCCFSNYSIITCVFIILLHLHFTMSILYRYESSYFGFNDDKNRQHGL